MPPLNNTLQTLPAENRLQIHAAAASIAPYPFTYRCVVQNLDLDQLDLFRAFMDCPNNCSRDFHLRIQFDSGVLASALELERRVIERRADADEQRRQEGVFRCEITRFMLVFGLERGRKVFGGEGDGGEGENGGGSGEGDRTMAESQARDTVQVLKRVRLTVNGNDRHSTLSAICNRFEAMVDVYVARSKGKSNVWRTDGLPDADPERAKTDEEIERKNRCQAAEQAKHLETVTRRKAKALARFFGFR
jgi:hypothetical protein